MSRDEQIDVTRGPGPAESGRRGRRRNPFEAGFDRSLYAAIPGHGRETALFWYLPFPPAADRRLRRPPRPRTG